MFGRYIEKRTATYTNYSKFSELHNVLSLIFHMWLNCAKLMMIFIIYGWNSLEIEEKYLINFVFQADNGGIVMISFASELIACSENSSIDHVISMYCVLVNFFSLHVDFVFFNILYI